MIIHWSDIFAFVFFFNTATINLRNDSCSNGALRLMDGQTGHEGRVEACYNGVWGSICDSSWTLTEANIVCKTLGHQEYGKKRHNGRYHWIYLKSHCDISIQLLPSFCYCHCKKFSRLVWRFVNAPTVIAPLLKAVLNGLSFILVSLGAQNYKNSHYGPGDRPMHIYNLACESYHSSISSCRINRIPYYYTGCNRYHEVGVKCDRKWKALF